MVGRIKQAFRPHHHVLAEGQTAADFAIYADTRIIADYRIRKDVSAFFNIDVFTDVWRNARSQKQHGIFAQSGRMVCNKTEATFLPKHAKCTSISFSTLIPSPVRTSVNIIQTIILLKVSHQRRFYILFSVRLQSDRIIFGSRVYSKLFLSVAKLPCYKISS